MKTLFINLLLICSCGLFAQLNVYAPAYPPMVIQDKESGEISGIASNVVKELVKIAELDIKLQILPWSNAYSKVINGENSLLYPVIRTKEREKLFNWIGPVNRFHYGIYSLKPVITQYNSIHEFGSSRIGVLRGGVDSSYLKKKEYENIIEGNSIELLLNMLIKGRIEYLMMDDATLLYYLDKISVPVTIYNHLSLDDVTVDPFSYLVLSRDSDEVYLEKLNSAMSELRSSGRWEELVNFNQ